MRALCFAWRVRKCTTPRAKMPIILRNIEAIRIAAADIAIRQMAWASGISSAINGLWVGYLSLTALFANLSRMAQYT